jgi:LmbE family N-acetylglucosaminyl deacetylase
MTVLVIAAHPDDEILGAGGTLARHVRAGDEVHAMVISEGAGSRYGDAMVAKLQEHARRAAAEIGFASLRLESLPDQRLETLPLIELTQRLEAVIDELQPDTVYTHFPEDVNNDHRVVARAAWTACRPYRMPFVRRFLVFETPSSTEWAWPITGSVFSPNHYVDIGETLDVKVQAMACYATELRAYPHPRSERALRERAAFWGSHIGRPGAEPFCVLREIW